MSPREQLDRKITDLNTSVVALGKQVADQIKQAVQSLEVLDVTLSRQVIAADRSVNAARYATEEACCRVIATEQPAARDLRAIITVLNIIVDLERIGDKAKDLAEVVPDVLKYPNTPRPQELKQMEHLAVLMLEECMQAFVTSNVELAKQAANHNKEMRALYMNVLHQTIEYMADAKKEKKVTATYGILQAAHHLDRVGDMVTNVAERVIYLATGYLEEIDTGAPEQP
jgi:phosphate transport system protein